MPVFMLVLCVYNLLLCLYVVAGTSGLPGLWINGSYYVFDLNEHGSVQDQGNKFVQLFSLGNPSSGRI